MSSAAAVVRCIAIGMLALAACGGPAPPSSSPSPQTSVPSAGPTAPASRKPPTVAPTATPDLPRIVDVGSDRYPRITAGPSPDFAVASGGSIFVSGVGDGIGRFDADGSQVETWSVPGDSCGALDAGYGAVWSATCQGPGLVRIDATSSSLTPVELGGLIPDSETSVGAGAGGVWLVVGVFPRYLLKVDPDRLEVVGRFAIPGSSSAVRVGFRAVWVADPPNDLVRRVDPADGTVAAEIPVGRKPQFLAVGEGAVWTLNQLDGTVSRIDPATNTVVATIELGETVGGGDIAVGGGSVWLRGNPTLLFRIDPETNRVDLRYGPPSGSGSLAVDVEHRLLWVTAHDTQSIYRVLLPCQEC